MTRRRRKGRGCAWTPAVRPIHVNSSLRFEYSRAPREVRVLEIRTSHPKPDGWDGCVRWFGDSWEQHQSRFDRWRVPSSPKAPIVWGELPPDKDFSYWLPKRIEAVAPQASFAAWREWMATPNPCAIGQPIPNESTEAWERRVYVNGRRGR